MTAESIAKMLKLITIYYPESVKRVKNPRQMVEAWGYALGDIPDDIGQAAFLDYVKTEKFPPHVADIIARARQIEGEETGDNVESYVEESMKAIRGDLKFEELSEVGKAYWKSQKAIDQVGYSENFVPDVVRGQLHRRLPEIIAKNRMIDGAPESVKSRIASDKVGELSDRQKRLLQLERDIAKDAEQLAKDGGLIE